MSFCCEQLQCGLGICESVVSASRNEPNQAIKTCFYVIMAGKGVIQKCVLTKRGWGWTWRFSKKWAQCNRGRKFYLMDFLHNSPVSKSVSVLDVHHVVFSSVHFPLKHVCLTTLVETGFTVKIQGQNVAHFDLKCLQIQLSCLVKS